MLSIALIQFDIVFGNPEANKKKVLEKVEQAKAASVNLDVIVLPELWTTGYDLTRLDTIADDGGHETIDFISDLAIKHHVTFVAGSIAKRSDGKVLNTTLVINSDGAVIAEYEKIHLFGLMNEDKYLAAGSRMGLFNLGDVKSANVICYDIRFPEWVRKHTVNGAEIVFVPAEWPTPRIDHWRALLVSRAIENQSFVVACNRVGQDPNNDFGGHSMVIDPWGTVLAEAGDDEEILYAEIDPSMVKEIREIIRIFDDRRPELY